MAERLLISVVDDDASIRESIPDLLKELGYSVQAFASAEEFLASDKISQTKCLVLDVAMPGMSGPDLQRELKRRRYDIPILFMTANVDARLRLRLIAQGAVDCLVKPFNDIVLLEAIKVALSGL